MTPEEIQQAREHARQAVDNPFSTWSRDKHELLARAVLALTEQQCPGVPHRGHTNLTEQRPTIMPGLNRQALIEDLVEFWHSGPAGDFLDKEAESWLVEHGFLTPGPEDESD